jgi:hypothetical protein
MQFAEVCSTFDGGQASPSRQIGPAGDALARRLAQVLRLHRLSAKPLRYGRERELWRVVRITRDALNEADAKAIAAADLALDLLSFDLCNE